ncbi:MAG: ABC transporter permease [Christensenellales bacterium]
MTDVMRRKKAGYKAKYVLSAIVFALGIAILATFAVFAIFGEKIAPYSVTQSFDKFLPCSKDHFLGTNNIGYDVWSQLIVATRYTLVVGVSSALACLVIGVTVGVFAGYIGGICSEAVNGIINFFLLIPMLPAAIVIASYSSGGQASIILTISLLCWCSTARAVRAKTMSVRESDYVKSLKSIGYGGARILFRHVLPNVADVVAARFIPSVASCIMVEATLSFLGLGSLENVTWGVMVNNAYTYGGITLGKYNWVLAPGVCIILLQISFYMVNQFVEFRKKIVHESTIKYK